MTSLYRMPGVGQTTATPNIRGIEKQGVTTPVSPSVSNAGRYLDFRDPKQAGENIQNRAAGFNDFMGTLMKIGGQVSDQTQLRVEQFRASDLISNPEALEIIKDGKGPANGLLWSFRPEVTSVVVKTAADEVAREAQEKWITNLAANTRLRDPAWLAEAKDEDLAQERLGLEDPESSQKLRNLTGISPAGTADAVGAYQFSKNRSWMQVQERRMAARLDNNAAIAGKEFDNEIAKFSDLLYVRIQADKDGNLGDEIFNTTDEFVAEYGPRLAAELERRGVDKTGFITRKLTNLSNDYETERALAQQAEREGREYDMTRLEYLQNGLVVLRAISDLPEWKSGEEGASIFDRAGENGGLGKTLAELQNSMGQFVDTIEGKRGEKLADQAEYELATLPEFTPEAVRTAMKPIMDELYARKDYKNLKAITKAIQVQANEVRRLDDDRAEQIQAEWLTAVRVRQQAGMPIPPEMVGQIAQLPPKAAAAVLSEVISGQRYNEQTQQNEVTQERSQFAASIDDAFKLGQPDPAMITTKAIDTQLRVDRLLKDKQIDPRAAAAYQGDTGRTMIGDAIRQRSAENLKEKLYKFFEQNGSTAKPTPAQMEEMRRASLDLASEQVLASIARVDQTKPAKAPPTAAEERQDEEENYQSVLRGNNGRLTREAIPKRFWKKGATPDDMMRAWNKETASLVDEKGKPLFGPNVSLERERIRREIEKDKSGKSNFIPLPTAPEVRRRQADPYGASRGAKPQPGSASPYFGNQPGTGGGSYGPQSSVPATPTNVAQGWNLLGLAPEELGPLNPTLAAAEPKAETMSVTVPPDQLPPPVVEKTGRFLVSMAGVDLDAQADGSAFMPKEKEFQPTASTEGMAVPAGGEAKPKALPVQNLTPSNVLRTSQYATGKAEITADAPPLPQVDARQPSMVIPLNARSRDNPWVYAVLATDLRVRNRTGGVSATLPDWMFPRSGIAPVPDFATGSFGGKVERPTSIVEEPPDGQGGLDIYIPSKQGYAVLPGRVKRIDFEPGYGNFIVVESVDPRNGNTVDVLYGHVGNARGQGFKVKVGDTVNAGSIIGEQGSTGNVRDADSIWSVDFLAPAPASSNSMVKYSDYVGLRKLVGDGLRRGQLPGQPNTPGILRGGGGGGVLSEKHPYVQAIGFAEGNLDQRGRPTGSYAGHTDPGNGARNVGIFSAQSSGGTPEAANRVWIKKLEGVMPQFDQQLRIAGAKPGTAAYEMAMVNLLDLYVQAPAAVMEAGGLLSRIPELLRGGGREEAIAAARAASFRTSSGTLDAPGFGNNWDRLLADQRRRARALRTRMTG